MEGGLARGVSAIILAAGANTRLSTIVPSYMKPAILINGKPLIQHALDHLQHWAPLGNMRRIIVASPHNALHLTQIVRGPALWVLQPEPLGVVEAITRALPLVDTDMVLILCADNTFDLGHAKPTQLQLLVDGRESMIGARGGLTPDEAARFTRFQWLHSADTPGVALLAAGDPDPQFTHVWVGPLLLATENARAAITRNVMPRNTDVVTFIRDATENGRALRAVLMNCSDLGIPEELR